MDKLVRKSGGQVDGIVMALIDAAFDKKEDVSQAISLALSNLGRKQPELVLSSCNSYLIKHQKLAQGHRVVLLNMMCNTIKDTHKDLPIDLARDVIILASSELTKSKNVEAKWQTAASNVLVVLGSKFCDDIMSELLQKLVPGNVPHYFVIMTLANLAKENVFGVVPFLKDILSRMLHMLMMVKQDNMRWVFAHCIGSFSEAILDYCANIDNAPFPDITKDRFYGDVFSAYEVMFNVWLQSKEAKVRLAIIEAFGPMSHLMEKSKLEGQIGKLLSGITNMYKKNTEHHIMTQSLCMILDSASADGAQMLVTMLEQLMSGLHLQACNEPDYNNIGTVKNHNEVLRCFQVLCQAYSDRVVIFLQLKLESGSDRSKAATLSIFRHLINSSDAFLSDKKEIILSGLLVCVHEQNLKVRKALAQVITALAHHDYLRMEGGYKMIEFIVRQCALTDETIDKSKTPPPDATTTKALKSMCENVLHLICTTVQIMDEVLWPYLLSFITPVHYTEAIMALSKSLSHLAAKKREDAADDYTLDYSTQSGTPKPHALLARLIVMAGHPRCGGNRGIHVLRFMQAMGPNISSSVVTLWDTVIPKLIQYFEDKANTNEWNQRSWEDLILKLLAKTLGEVDSEEWLLALGREFGMQMSLYVNYPKEKNFLFKSLGVVLRRINTRDFIREHLNLIFCNVDHNSQLEREGCAFSVGFCAATHLDQCLVKLEEVAKTEMVRKSTGFMGLLKDKTEADVEKIKSTVILCYGHAVFYGPPGLIKSRLETHVLRVINPLFSTVKDPTVRQNLIKAVELIGKALQPSHTHESGEIVFAKKGDLLKHMQGYLAGEQKMQLSETRNLAIDAITNLIILEPNLKEGDLQDIIKLSADSVYSVPLNARVCDTERSYDELICSAVESFNKLMKEITGRDLSPNALLAIMKHLEPYLLSVNDFERERVIQTVETILTYYLETMPSNSESSFIVLGNLCGRLLPRCTDPVLNVRLKAVECVRLLQTINDRFEGVPSTVSDERIESLGKLGDKLKDDNPAMLFSVVNDLAVVINKKTPDDQLKTLVYSLLEGLSDLHSQSASGACAMLHFILKSRGAELHSEINNLVFEVHNKLLDVSYQQTITGTVVAMRALASHNLIPVLTAFLKVPLPFSHVVKEFWQTLAKDRDLTQDTFDHLLDLLNRSAPFIEKEHSRDKSPTVRVATQLPVAINCALTEIFRTSETEDLVDLHFSKLFSAILLRLGSCVGVKPILAAPESQKGKKKDSLLYPMEFAAECCKEFLTRAKCDSFRTFVEKKGGWNKLNDEATFCEGLETIALGLCQCVPAQVSDVVSCLMPALASSYDNQRIVPTTIFAELIKQKCNGDVQLVELLMNSLLSKLVDPSHLVRRMCIRGLGNVASIGKSKLQAYATTILSAMMAGMDDKEDPDSNITLEAMSGLSRILSELDETSIRQILINICLRIRPCFEKDKDDVRAAAISLFGNLSRFGSGPSHEPFIEQIHTNFVSILLHMQEEAEVTKACKHALRQLGPRLGSVAINDMFQKHLIEDGQLHYGEFMNDLSRLIVTDFPEKVNFYVSGCVSFFKSPWDEIRSNASIFAGFLLGNLPKDKRDAVSKEHVCTALIMLLKDPSAKVRCSSAEAMSLLFDY